MKRFVTFTLGLAAVLSTQAQTAPTQTAPTQPAQQQRPAQPAPTVPPIPGISQPNTRPQVLLTNAPHTLATNRTAFATNQFPNGLTAENVTPADVEGLLLNLQAHMEQALPVLAALGSARPAANAAAPGNTPNTAPARPGAQSPMLPPTGNTSPRTVPPNQGTVPATPPTAPMVTGGSTPGGQTLVGSVGTNFFSMNQETFQLVRVLQARLQQTLPVLQALNGTAFTNATIGRVPPGGFNNRLVPLTNNLSPDQRMLMPTGR